MPCEEIKELRKDINEYMKNIEEELDDKYTTLCVRIGEDIERGRIARLEKRVLKLELTADGKLGLLKENKPSQTFQTILNLAQKYKTALEEIINKLNRTETDREVVIYEIARKALEE